MTTVVKVNRRHPNFTLYIGREWAGLPQSKWHNPYSLYHYTLADSMRLFEQHIRDTPALREALYEIDDQVLGCWCHPKPCHGDILIKLRNEQLEQERESQ